VIPAFWNDNLVTLAPGETRTFTCRIPDIDNVRNIEISGWNVKEQSFEIQ
jgi:exo-1,4-beta-D-glucosaminidase